MNRLKAWIQTWYHSFVCNDNVKRSYPERGYDERTRGSALRYGRWFFRYGRKPLKKYEDSHVQEYDHPHTFELHWCWFYRWNSAAVGVAFDVDEEYKVMFRFGIPWLVSIYIGHSAPRRFMNWVLPWYTSDEIKSGGWPLTREVEVSVHNGSVWIHLWVTKDGEYGDYGRTPLAKWRCFNFSINPLDLLGRTRCKTEVVEEERAVFIAMPEGDYAALLQLERRTWTRALWPWWPLKRVRVTRDITVPDAIPFSGKGENSWDCGEDGIVSTGFDAAVADTDEKACALFAARALETRVRRGDPRKWPESPGDRAERLAAQRLERTEEEAMQKDRPE